MLSSCREDDEDEDEDDDEDENEDDDDDMVWLRPFLSGSGSVGAWVGCGLRFGVFGLGLWSLGWFLGEFWPRI